VVVVRRGKSGGHERGGNCRQSRDETNEPAAPWDVRGVMWEWVHAKV
jgi:hypothetical protein